MHVVLFQLTKVMDKSGNNTRDVNIWDSVYSVTEQFFTNLEKLGDLYVNQTSITTWFKPIISTLQAVGNPSISRLVS